MTDGDDPTNDALIQAWLADKQMHEIELYKTQGRRFERLQIDELEQRWAKAFAEWAKLRAQHKDADDRDMRGLQAEIVLRNREVPLELVQAELEELLDIQNARLPRVVGAAQESFAAELEEFERTIRRYR